MNITPHDVINAQTHIADYLVRTPLIHSAPLSTLVGADVWLKCECFAEIGSFKARGALNCLLHLSEAQRAQGLICASTGNHGAGMAWAATTIGASCTVVVPHGTPDIKMQNMHNAGARVIVDGSDWGESCVIARQIAARDQLLYLEDGEDPFIMAGAGTVALEIVQHLPQVSDILLPVGGGNFVAGCAIATKAHQHPHLRIFGVQSDAAPAVTESMRCGQIVQRPTTSFAGGIATTAPVPQAFAIMQRYVDDMLLVPETSLYSAIGTLVRMHGFVVEGAGAAPVAALMQHAERFRGRTVVLVLSGRNLDVGSLQCALAS
ncbi:MAG: threonine/serine dehydratase [Roseiflexaceae bacterium]